MLEHLESPKAARQWCNDQRASGQKTGFIPTMGALHTGHISLIDRARADNSRVIVSIFVNPLQFNNPEDLRKYPRDLAGDLKKLDFAGVDAVFTGSAEEFLEDAYGKPADQLPDPGIYARGMEGAHRPGHFAGVREVVARLFRFVGPCRAYFGEKDYQQLQIIRELAAEMTGIEIISCPTLREVSGLAKSSRNLRLSAQGLEDAAIIYRAMQAANSAWEQGERHPAALQDAMLKVLDQGPIELEYAEIRDPLHWTPVQPEDAVEKARAFVAGSVEQVRLIDNMKLGD